MTDKQSGLDALSRLNENVSLEEIAEVLSSMPAIRRGRSDNTAGRTKTQEEVHNLVESWATTWTSK